VRNSASEKSDPERNTLSMPAGVSPCHFGPTIMKLLPSLPVARLPM
jgi:hypothetical protein